MLYLLIYSWVTYALDWSSTIVAHDCRVEENPFMRDVWCQYGDFGFTIVSIGFALTTHIAVVIGWRYGYKWVTAGTLLAVITLKLLIALTNLVLIPYFVTGWWTY